MSEQRKRLLNSFMTNLVRRQTTRAITVQSNRLDKPGITTCIAQELQHVSHALLIKLPSFQTAVNIGDDRGHFVP